MADNYLERRMEEYRSQPAEARRPAVTLERLLRRNRSVRGYDSRFLVRGDQLRRIAAVCTKIPSARNRQSLRLRPVLSDEMAKVLPHIRMGGALPELHLPLPGTEPNACIIICSTVAEDRWIDIDLGIAVQSMLLQTVEIGLNGLCIGAFDREAIREAFALPYDPILILAIGKSLERIELVEVGAGDDLAYYRRDGVHYVPKIRLEELLLSPVSAESGARSDNL